MHFRAAYQACAPVSCVLPTIANICQQLAHVDDRAAHVLGISPRAFTGMRGLHAYPTLSLEGLNRAADAATRLLLTPPLHLCSQPARSPLPACARA